MNNSTQKKLSFVDFVKENPQLIEEFKEEYRFLSDSEYTQEKLIESARKEVKENKDYTLYPGDNYCVFGDEQGTLIGGVFDYILRDGGKSENFIWEFKEYHR